MKNFFVLFFCFIFVFIFCGCSKKTENNNGLSRLEMAVVKDLENTSNYQNLNDETIKTLSVIYRNNHIKQNDFNNFEYSSNNDKIKNIVVSTRNVDFNDNNYGYYKTNSVSWEKTIKKSEILSFLKSKNIYLSSLSSIEPVFENEKIKFITIGGKQINFDEISDYFNLPSDNITEINQTLSEIIIKGKYEEKFIDVDTIETLSLSGFSYQEILESF